VRQLCDGQCPIVTDGGSCPHNCSCTGGAWSAALRAAQLAPQHARVIFAQAQLLRDARQWSAAAQLLRRALQLEPPVRRKQVARCLFHRVLPLSVFETRHPANRQHAVDASLSCYAHVPAASPTTDAATHTNRRLCPACRINFALCSCASKLGRRAEALAYARAAIEAEPTRVAYWAAKMHLERRAGNFAQAQADARRAAELDSDIQAQLPQILQALSRPIPR
jgi:tetratricopeptide (TPR) repeat protein